MSRVGLSRLSQHATPSNTARKQAAAEECALQRIISVHTAAAETRYLAGGIKAGHRVTGCIQHPRLKVRMQAAQRLARQHMQAHGDQRSHCRIEQSMRFCGTHQPVAEITARAVDRRYLRILTETVFDLPVAGLYLVADVAVLCSSCHKIIC